MTWKLSRKSITHLVTSRTRMMVGSWSQMSLVSRASCRLHMLNIWYGRIAVSLACSLRHLSLFLHPKPYEMPTPSYQPSSTLNMPTPSYTFAGANIASDFDPYHSPTKSSTHKSNNINDYDDFDDDDDEYEVRFRLFGYMMNYCFMRLPSLKPPKSTATSADTGVQMDRYLTAQRSSISSLNTHSTATIRKFVKFP